MARVRQAQQLANAAVRIGWTVADLWWSSWIILLLTASARAAVTWRGTALQSMLLRVLPRCTNVGAGTRAVLHTSQSRIGCHALLVRRLLPASRRCTVPTPARRGVHSRVLCTTVTVMSKVEEDASSGGAEDAAAKALTASKFAQGLPGELPARLVLACQTCACGSHLCLHRVYGWRCMWILQKLRR